MKCQNQDCQKEFPAVRSTAKYCSEKCKKVVQRAGKPKGRAGRPSKDQILESSTMKKKSTSHVVQLKQKLKERLLAKGVIGKPKGSSTALPASSDASDSDAPPCSKPVTDEERLAMYQSAAYVTPVMRPEAIESLMKLAEKLRLNDATAGLPPEALPAPNLKNLVQQGIAADLGIPVESVKMIGPVGVVSDFEVDKNTVSKRHPLTSFTQLPVESHSHQNDLAKSVISKVPTPKLDPNSEEAELARLLKHQMPVKKKGGET